MKSHIADVSDACKVAMVNAAAGRVGQKPRFGAGKRRNLGQPCNVKHSYCRSPERRQVCGWNAHSGWPLRQITNAPENRRSNLSAGSVPLRHVGVVGRSLQRLTIERSTSLRLLAACSKAGSLRGIRQGRRRLQEMRKGPEADPFLCNLDLVLLIMLCDRSGPSRLACTPACRRGGTSFPSGIGAWPPPYS